MSLYTKYRPKDWDSVVGQDFIVTILKSTLANKSAGHAYIFTGSRGTGKTTSARIFAKALNCTDLQNGNPCHKCENCQSFDNNLHVDIIEIDAASNTSVDDMRDLIDEAKYLPMQGEYKIYIIDEVHMLSGSAFNALLKTLEEPPAHVKFVMATTEIHKVPETIRSRAQRFDFQKIQKNELISRLEFVTQSENISTETWSLEIIADLARGGMRDALTLLEQYTVNNKLSKEILEKSFSLIDTKFLHHIIDSLFFRNFSELKNILETLKMQNISVNRFFDQFILTLRDKMVENMDNENFVRYEEIFLTFRDAYSSIFAISNDWILIETTLLQAINSHSKNQIITEKIIQKIEIPQPEIRPTPTESKEIKPLTTKIPTPPSPTLTNNDFKAQEEEKMKKIGEEITKNFTKNETQENEIPTKNPKNSEVQEFNFRKLLLELKSDPVVLATLKTASFKQKDTHLELTFSSKWNADKMNESRFQGSLIDILNTTFGGNWTVESRYLPASANYITDDVF